jgi:hypothetical protein
MKKIILLFITGIFLSAFSVAQTPTWGRQFDGIDDYIQIPVIPAYTIGTGNFTIEMRIKMNTYQLQSASFLFFAYLSPFANLGLIYNNNSLSPYGPPNSLRVSLANIPYVFNNLNLNDQVCHHIAVTRAGTTLSLYIDGSLIQSVVIPVINITAPQYITLGSDIAPYYEYCGFMQEVRFWNVARTQTQIQTYMNYYVAGSSTGLIGYWWFDDFIQETVEDLSLNNNDGSNFGSVRKSGCSNCTLPSNTITGSWTGCNSILLVAQPGNTNYKWYAYNFGTPTPIPNSNVATYTATASNTYFCLITNSCGTVMTNTFQVTLPAAPAASITVAAPTSFCSPGSVTLNANIGSGLSYQWRQNNVNIPGETNPSYTANTSGNYNCIVTNSCGSATSNSITVTVLTSIPSAIIIAGGATSFCSPGSVILSANTGSGLSYQWRVNGVNIAGSTLSSFAATTGGNYSCLVTNSCGSTLSNIITITEDVLPAATVSIVGTLTFCSPGSVTINVSTCTGCTYQWRQNSIAIPGATTSSYIATSTGNYDCSVTNTCGSTTSNMITVTTAAVPATPGSITGQATGVCSSVKTYSIATVSGATGYTWTVPPGSTISSGQGTTSVNVAFASSFGSGNVSVIATNTCGSSGASSLAVSGVPAQPGGITGPASVCHNQNNVLYSIAAVTGATSYTWTVPPGTQIKNGQGTVQIRVRFGNSAGNITVRANNSCGQSPVRTLAIAMPCRSAEEFSSDDFDIALYPNPATDKLSVICYWLSGNEVLTIHNAVGEAILKFEIRNSKSEINIRALPSGIYFAEFISGEQKKVLKFIKQE